jgi:GntR family transcriptional repressor for pyruvate dehydrogenase complex
MTDFLPVKRQNISDEITAQILQQILRGAFRPGERLPPERELAITFDTNRNTLREALRNLQTLRVVAARQGDGLRVLDYHEEGEINLLPHYLRHCEDNRARIVLVQDMLRLRRVLLAEVCGTMALRGSEEAHGRLAELLAQQRRNVGIPEKLIATDVEIAMTMVRASGSLAYKWIFNTMAKLFTEVASQWPMLWVYPEGYVESLAEVIAATREGDAERARQLMFDHLGRSDDIILATLRQLDSLLAGELEE